MWTCIICGLMITPQWQDLSYMSLSPQCGLAVIWEGTEVIQGSVGSSAPISGCHFFSSDVVLSWEAMALTYKHHLHKSK